MVKAVKKSEGKATSARTEKTRRTILEAAIRLFSVKGYRSTSVADIAAEAGVAKSAVFWHFDSKDGLLKMVVDELISTNITEMIKAAVNEEIKDEADMLDKVLEYFKNKLNDYPELNRAYYLLMVETAHENDEAHKPFVQSLDAYQKFLNISIENGRKKGIFRNDFSTQDLSLLFEMLTMGAYCFWYRQPSVDTTELYRIVKNVLNIVLFARSEQ